MPAKKAPFPKNAPKMTRGERAAMVINRWATMENDLAHLEKELKAAQAELAEAKEYGEDIRQKLQAEKRELEFWVEESDRYRDQVVALLRERAERARPGEDS